MHILDTNTCSYLLEGEPAARLRPQSVPPSVGVYTSVVSQAELLHGAYASLKRRRETRIASTRRLLAGLDGVLPVTPAVAERYAEVKSRLMARGTPIPANDIWIAAIALEAGMVLVTNDEHFRHVRGLKEIVAEPLDKAGGVE